MMIDEFDYFLYQQPCRIAVQAASADNVRMQLRGEQDRTPSHDEIHVIEYDRMDSRTSRRSRRCLRLTAVFAVTSVLLFALFLALVCTSQPFGWVVASFALLAVSLGGLFYCLITYFATTDYYTRIERPGGELVRPSDASRDYND